MKEEQIPTHGVTLESIMSAPDFGLGLSDVRRGIPFDWRNNTWGYERGRLFGHIAPLSMPLRIGRRLNPKAVSLCRAAFDRKLVL
jgi:hypothetical protein